MNNVEHIVNEYTKIDLHIHTSASKKDGLLVKNNTVENIEKILLPKLIENEVNMVALTDHNVFSMEHYQKLKSFENKENLKKVLPGIEFDVTKHKHRFHVIAIFDDSNQKGIKNIQIVLNKFSKCFNNGAYAFTDFVKIIDEIKLPCVTIAHQKSDPKQGDHNQDLSGIGYDNFKEELYIDYFESLEFASLDTEGFLKLRKVEDNLENLRYITGSDCHNWENYPSKDSRFQYTFIKALPSFMGLVMALTEFNRVSLVGGSLNTPVLASIKYERNQKEEEIRLSPGINVIIGDNSVGKSAILEVLFNQNPNKYHMNYLTDKGLTFTYLKDLENKTLYNGQGSIRKKYEKNGAKLEDDKVIKNLFIEPSTEVYTKNIRKNIQNFIDYLKYNDEIFEKQEAIDVCINVPFQEVNTAYPTFNEIELKCDLKTINKKIEKIEEALFSISSLIEIEDDKKIRNRLNKIQKELESIKLIYLKEKRSYQITNLIVAGINRSVKKIEKEMTRLKSDAASTIDQFERESQKVISNYCSYLKKVIHKKEIPNYRTLSLSIEPNINGNYQFYSSIKKLTFSQEDFEKMILYIVDKSKYKKYLDLKDIGLEQISLNRFENKESELTKEEFFVQQCEAYIKKNVTSKDTYIQKNNEVLVSKGYSAGKNALIYLDIIKDSNNYNLLVFDQPEDDVSQNKISSELIETLNLARKKKQIIFITHNPQLVVNLDVDNVIILEQDQDLNIDIKYGALEYEEKGFKVLDKVAEMLDGGKEVLRKRWRRYGKQK